VTDRLRYRTWMCDSSQWDGFEFRPDDVVISTSPKCGTTWTQMLCALLIFDDWQFEQPLTQISPWLDQSTQRLDDVLTTLSAQRHRRFIKTHTPFDGLPHDDRVTYLCVGRDPRDVAMSMDHHWSNMDVEQVLRVRATAVGTADTDELLQRSPMGGRPDDARVRFCMWVDNDRPPHLIGSSLRALLHHVDTFWVARERENVSLFHYSDLEADLIGELRRLADVLRISVSNQRLRELAPAAGFERMRERAAEVAPNADIGIFRDIEGFFHSGSSGQWRDVLDADDLAHYRERVSQLAAPDLARWMHLGSRASVEGW